MSKQAAMALATGQPVTEVTPSLITPDLPPPSDAAPVAPEVKNGLASDRIALLAKKEAKIVARDLEIKKREAELKEIEAKYKATIDEVENFKTKRKSNPIEALKEIGFTETEIVNYIAAQENKEPTTEEIAKKIAAEELDNYKKEQAEIAAKAEKAKNEATIKEYRADIVAAIKSDPEKYEFSNFYAAESEDLGYRLALEYARLGEEPPTPKQIAESVEWYYEQKDKEMTEKIKKRQLVQKTSDLPVKEEPLKPRVNPQPTPSKTLTNKVAATTASTMVRRETFEQKKQRLIESLKNGTYKTK